MVMSRSASPEGFPVPSFRRRGPVGAGQVSAGQMTVSEERAALQRALAQGERAATPAAFSRWQGESVQGLLDYAAALLECGQVTEAGVAFAEVTSAGYATPQEPQWAVWGLRGQALAALALLDAGEARRLLTEALAWAEASPYQSFLNPRFFMPGTACSTWQPPPMLGTWWTLALTCLFQEDWDTANAVLKQALAVPRLERYPAVHAALIATEMLVLTFAPELPRRVRPDLAGLIARLPPRHARFPRVVMALCDALAGRDASLIRLSLSHAELSDPLLLGHDGLAGLALLCEEVALLLGVHIEARSLYGRALQLIWSGDQMRTGLILLEAALGRATGVVGMPRRAELYRALKDRVGVVPAAFPLEPLPRTATPAPMLDRLNYARLAEVPGFPVAAASRLALLGHVPERRVLIRTQLLGVPSLFEDHHLYIGEGRLASLPSTFREHLSSASPDLGPELALLTLLGQAPGVNGPLTPAELRTLSAAAGPAGDRAFRRTALALRRLAGPLALLEEADGSPLVTAEQETLSWSTDRVAHLRLSRWSRLESDVPLLGTLLGSEDLWDALHLLVSPLDLTGVPWIDASRTRVVADLERLILPLDLRALPGGERSRLHRALGWMEVERERMSSAPAGRDIETPDLWTDAPTWARLSRLRERLAQTSEE